MKFLVPLLLVLTIAGAGCASRPVAGASAAAVAAPAPKVAPVLKTLGGTRWQLVELNGSSAEPAVAGWPAQTIEFEANAARANGHAGVNRFGARCDVDGGNLSFGPLAMTRRAGPSAQMEIERRYTVVLSAVIGWRQEGANLVFVTPASVRAAVLAPLVKGE